MSISDQSLYVAMVEGAAIVGARTVPYPHSYTITTRRVVHPISPERAQALVDAKIIAGKPQDALWDTIHFRAANPDQVRTWAFEAFPRGWGYCAACGERVEPSKRYAQPTATRHGFAMFVDADGKKRAGPACDGSLKPLLDPIVPRPPVAANAA